MKKRSILAALACMLMCGAARAMELPSNAVFSPGLKKLAALESTQPAVEATAQIGLEKALYARDLSVLGAMLDGLTVTYQRDGGETLAFSREGEMLGAYALPENSALDALEARFADAAVLERVLLADLAAWLEGLQPGEALAMGFCVSEPFSLVRTMSDDGTRLTKISISGAIARDGEAPWQVTGYLRQPAGRAPKDTFEITLTQDADNGIELLYSALRENEVTRKNKEGTASVRTTLKAAGKIAGSSVSSRLSVTMKNRWTAEGDALSERISITASLGHTDKTPYRRMQRLNDVAAEMKHAIRLTTHEGGDEAVSLTDAVSLEVVLDGNTFLTGSADVSLCAGAQVQPMQAQPMDDGTAMALARAIWRQLDDAVKEKIQSGL